MRLDRLCDNRSACVVRPFELIDRHGRDVVTVVAKLSWTVSAQGQPRLSWPQPPIRPAGSFRGVASSTSLSAFGERTDDKPGTDIVMTGFAYPPAEGGAGSQEVSLRVETGSRTLHKRVTVYGPRIYRQNLLGEVAPGKPEPLEKTELCYELAYGGSDYDTDKGRLVEMKNPAGCGVAHDPFSLIGKAAPRIEEAGDGQAPAGFGPIPASWSPRAELHGTTDAAWAKRRAPLLPRDFDPRHNCVSHPDLWSPEPLLGDEPVEVLGATPEGVWRFKLPRYAPRFSCLVRGEEIALETHLDTYFIDAEERRVELVWRATYPLPRKAERLVSVIVRSVEPLDDTYLQDVWRRVPAAEPAESPVENEPWTPMITN